MHIMLRIFLLFVIFAGALAIKSNRAYKESHDAEADLGCHHHHHHHHHHQMPEFLKHVSAEARIQFYFMMKDFTVSFDKKLEELKEWAEKNNVEEEVNDWIDKIMMFWDDVNKNITKVLDELPEVYPKVYGIMSDGSLTAMDMLLKIRALKLDRTVAKALHAVSMIVIHSSGQYPYMSTTAGNFFNKVTGMNLKNDSWYHLFLN